MYYPYENTMCVDQSIFYGELNLASPELLRQWVKRNKLVRLRTAGNGRCGLIDWKSIPGDMKKIIKKAYGDPYNKDNVQELENQLVADADAALYFQNYKFDNGTGIPESKIKQYYAEAQILDLYDTLCKKIQSKKRLGASIKVTDAKNHVVAVIKDLATIKGHDGKSSKYPHKLPSNYRSMDRKLKKYKADGYASLIHSNLAKESNSKKITGPVADWLLAQYCLPNKPYVPMVHTVYMQKREEMNWPSLTERAIGMWLEQPTQRKKWYLARHGAEEYRRVYGHKITRDRDQMFPNCHWAIDGTKLDWLHLEDNALGMAAKMKIDVVFDVYSEKILGYYIGDEHENYTQHFTALKMAAQESQSRPYLINYDGQGGHNTDTMQKLYSQLVAKNGGTHYKHRAREHGSPAEQLFKRFQMQVLNQKWFSDGQGVASSKTLNSKPNIDFIMENKHRLSSVDQLKAIFKLEVHKWNTMKHPKLDATRVQVYNQEPIISEPLNMFELMDMFWVTTKEPRRYERDGIKPVIRKEQYHFEVYDQEGLPDLDFRDKYTESRFFVQYDPEQLDNYVRLLMELPNGDRVFIADAQPVKKVKQVPVLMTTEDHEHAHKMRKVRDAELKRIENENRKLQDRTGITPDTLIDQQELEHKFGGKLPKEQRTTAETDEWMLLM
jgi:hypothetical protein